MNDSNTVFEEAVRQHRAEILAYCYRMTGSVADAEEITQEIMLRAWRAMPSFEGRSSMRTWLFRIANNACFDALATRRRSLPTVASPAASPTAPLPQDQDGALRWMEPCPSSYWEDLAQGPESQLSMRESVAMAFLVALQELTPLQRASLLLRDVFGWSAEEVADSLQTTVAAINSATQRARGTSRTGSTSRTGNTSRTGSTSRTGNTSRTDSNHTGDASQAGAWLEKRQAPQLTALDANKQKLFNNYMSAWQRLDTDAICSLLCEDAQLSMPPVSAWFAGRADIAVFLRMVLGGLPGAKATEVMISGEPGFALYLASPDGSYQAHSLHTVSLTSAGVSDACAFMDPTLFARFGLPPQI